MNILNNGNGEQTEVAVKVNYLTAKESREIARRNRKIVSALGRV